VAHRRPPPLDLPSAEEKTAPGGKENRGEMQI